MKIVITGSTGSIGKKVCEILAGQKKEIISFSKSVGLSVENRPQVKEVFKNSDYVIHMAAEERGSTISKIVETNIIGSKIVLEEAANLRIPVKLISSTEALLAWHKPYGASKYMMEQLGLEKVNDTIVNIVRFPTVWGSEESIVEKWINSVIRGDPIEVFLFSGEPKKKFFITIDEAAKACADLELKPSGNIDCSYEKVIDCMILAEAIIKFFGKGSISKIERDGYPYEIIDEGISSGDIDSIDVDDAVVIIKEIYDRQFHFNKI